MLFCVLRSSLCCDSPPGWKMMVLASSSKPGLEGHPQHACWLSFPAVWCSKKRASGSEGGWQGGEAAGRRGQVSVDSSSVSTPFRDFFFFFKKSPAKFRKTHCDCALYCHLLLCLGKSPGSFTMVRLR